MLAYLKKSFIISWYVKIIAELSASMAIRMFKENLPSRPPYTGRNRASPRVRQIREEKVRFSRAEPISKDTFSITQVTSEHRVLTLRNPSPGPSTRLGLTIAASGYVSNTDSSANPFNFASRILLVLSALIALK